MGQKVHPYGFRLGFNKPWRSRWFAKQGYAKLLQEDLELKAALTEAGGRGGGNARIAQGSVPDAGLLDGLVAKVSGS